MKYPLIKSKLCYFLILFLATSSCLENRFEERNNLIFQDKTEKIPTENIDTVKKYLSGFWLQDKYVDVVQKIVWLNFDRDYTSTWYDFKYSPRIKSHRDMPVSVLRYSDIVLVEKNEQVLFTSGRDTLNINFLSLAKFSIKNDTFYRHLGYPFLFKAHSIL